MTSLCSPRIGVATQHGLLAAILTRGRRTGAPKHRRNDVIGHQARSKGIVGGLLLLLLLLAPQAMLAASGGAYSS